MTAAAMASTLLRRYRRSRDLRWRTVPPITVHPGRGTPTVYYLVPHSAHPQGGVKMAYRHVEVLTELGLSAAVLQVGTGAPPSWFSTTARVEGTATLKFRENDVLVVPEVFGPSMAAIDPDVRVVVFNQGGYITFDALDFDQTQAGAPYRDIARLEGILTVSHDSAELIRLSFPDLHVQVARPVIDPAVFSPGPAGAPRDGIALVPSRRASERNQLRHILRSRGTAADITFLTGRTEREMAQALRACAVFVSLSERDGFGLPPAEAMACGSYVVGYPGGGGEEFFDPDYCTPVASTAQLVLAIEQALAMPEQDRAAAGSRASAAVLGHYSLEGLRDDLNAVFEPLVRQ